MILFPKLTNEEFKEFAKLIYDLSGISFKDSKLFLLSNRLRKRLRATGFSSYEEYLKYIKSPGSKAEIEEMLNVVTTNETYFFRHVQHYDSLMEYIIPRFLKEKETPISIWSAGCSSGEEVYTLCILLKDRDLLKKSLFSIYASDLSSEILAEAQSGLYDEKKLRFVPDEFRGGYFKKDYSTGKYLLDRDIVDFVKFSRVNLKSDPYVRKYDIILCRNVMIYFDAITQHYIVNKFYESLNKDSYFFVGHSESLYSIDTKFEFVKVGDVPIYHKT